MSVGVQQSRPESEGIEVYYRCWTLRAWGSAGEMNRGRALLGEQRKVTRWSPRNTKWGHVSSGEIQEVTAKPQLQGAALWRGRGPRVVGGCCDSRPAAKSLPMVGVRGPSPGALGSDSGDSQDEEWLVPESLEAFGVAAGWLESSWLLTKIQGYSSSRSRGSAASSGLAPVPSLSSAVTTLSSLVVGNVSANSKT